MGGLALEPQLLVLGSDVVPEKFQGLLHGSLGIGAEVPGVLALQNLDDGLGDELQGGVRRGRSLGRHMLVARWESATFSFFQGCLSGAYYTLGTAEWSP